MSDQEDKALKFKSIIQKRVESLSKKPTIGDHLRWKKIDNLQRMAEAEEFELKKKEADKKLKEKQRARAASIKPQAGRKK